MYRQSDFNHFSSPPYVPLKICLPNSKNPFGPAILHVKSVFFKKIARSVPFGGAFEKNGGLKTYKNLHF